MLESKMRIFIHVIEEILVAQGGGHIAPPPPTNMLFFRITSSLFLINVPFFYLPCLESAPDVNIYSFMKKNLFSVPDAFKEVTTRLKKLRWRDHKKVMICSLHFESNLFKGAKKGKVDFDRAIAIYNSSGPSLPPTGPSLPSAGPSPPSAGPSPTSAGPSPPSAGPSPPSAAKGEIYYTVK